MKVAKDNSVWQNKWFSIMLFAFLILSDIGSGIAQVSRKYLPGENNTVEMIVYIIGQVQKPGSYRVQDKTNLIELISVAGGPTEFSNLGDVTVTHILPDSLVGRTAGNGFANGPRIVKYNINKYLKEENISPPPVLKPGDVVMVPKNKWGRWRNVATIFRDVSVVVTAYLLYLRAAK